jgi:hypothetical protein
MPKKKMITVATKLTLNLNAKTNIHFKYRAVCVTDNFKFVGGWHDSEAAAQGDADRHKQQSGNNHRTKILVEETHHNLI